MENKSQRGQFDLNLPGVQRLQEHHLKEAEDCNRNIQHCKKLISDYEDLQSTLETLPYKRSYKIMVPFCGDLAFFPGQLVHTNEITALIGDNWFVDVSAKEAQEIANRRKLELKDTLDKLELQERNLSEKLKYDSQMERDFMNEDGIVEIREELTDKNEESVYSSNRISGVKVSKSSEIHVAGSSAEEATTSTSTVVPEPEAVEIDDAYWDRLEKLETDNNELSDSSNSESIEEDNTIIRFSHTDNLPKSNLPAIIEETSIQRPDQVQKLISQDNHRKSDSGIVHTTKSASTSSKPFTGTIIESQNLAVKFAPVTAKVVEKSGTSATPETPEETKPISRFKAQRIKSGRQ